MVVVVVVVVVVTVAVVSGRNRALILRTQSKVFPIHTRSLILIFDSFLRRARETFSFLFFVCFFFFGSGLLPCLSGCIFCFLFLLFSSMYLRLVSFRGCGDCRSLRSLLFLLLRRRDNESPNKHTPVSRENPFDEFHR